MENNSGPGAMEEYRNKWKYFSWLTKINKVPIKKITFQTHHIQQLARKLQPQNYLSHSSGVVLGLPTLLHLFISLGIVTVSRKLMANLNLFNEYYYFEFVYQLRLL